MALNLNMDQPDFLKRRNEQLQKRMEESGSNRDFLFKKRVQRYAAKEGFNIIRILPATWDEAYEYGYSVYIHYNVGMNRSGFFCLDKMEKGRCPICVEINHAIKRNDAEFAKSIQAQRKSLVYLIDRGQQDKGPMLWTMPYTKVYKQLLTLAYSRSTGEFLWIEHQDKGHDVSFQVQGSKLNIQYIGLKIEWDETPLSKDQDLQKKWMDQIKAESIPDLLEFKTEEYIKAALMGNTDEPVSAKPITSGHGEAELNAAFPSASAEASNVAEKKAINLDGMKRKEMVQLIESKHMDVDPDMWSSDDELRDAIRVELGEFN